MANYAIFDEQYYLASYPWVKPAIDAGVIKSGREHFEKFGREGGLTKVSRYFDENAYLTVNTDLKPFIRTFNPNGLFATGLDHFIEFGYDEGLRRAQASFEYSEDFYLANNSELRSFIGPMHLSNQDTSISFNSGSKKVVLELHFLNRNT